MSPTLVHADLRAWLNKHRGESRAGVLAQVLTDIRSVSDQDLWMPTFNYEFCRGTAFDVRETPSQVGVLSEYFRTKVGRWRTAVPVFSVSGVGPEPLSSSSSHSDSSVIEPFGSVGVFAELVHLRGSVLMAGCDLRFLTLAHYAEVHGGVAPPYRYDKDFPGQMGLEDGTRRDVIVRYHVTPLRDRVTYDWEVVRNHMMAQGLLRNIPRWNQGWLLDAAGFVDAWQQRSVSDPLWALSAQSRSWVDPMLDRLGRRFRQTDFESRS